MAIFQIFSRIKSFIEIKRLYYIIGLKIMTRCFKHLYAKKVNKRKKFLFFFNFRKIRINAKITKPLQLKIVNCIYIVSCHLREKNAINSMKKTWRKFVSSICSSENKWSGISSLILLYFVVRDVSTLNFFLVNHGRNSGKRVNQSSDKNNHDGEG